jgi:hypothetical protein
MGREFAWTLGAHGHESRHGAQGRTKLGSAQDKLVLPLNCEI